MTNNYTNDEHLLAEQFIDMVKKNKHLSQVPNTPDSVLAENITITSAVPLTEEESKRIIDLCTKKIDKPLGKVEEIVDSSMLTGVSIESENFYFEVSGRKTLNELQTVLNGNY